jgi:phosphoglycerol transferase MdoB-like AlkP superfamily enzyme
MNLLRTKILPIIALSVLALSNVALAQQYGQQYTGIAPTGPGTVGGLVGLLGQIVRWVYIIFFIIAVLFIILAAFSYLTAAGDEEKVKTAKNRIIYAAVAIIVALLAVGFEAIIRTFLVAPGA